MEANGTPLAFSRGCSFYRLDDGGHIVYGRDIVEPPSKPGDAGMSIMGAVFPLVRMMPKAQPSQPKVRHEPSRVLGFFGMETLKKT
jgi:hypothetical protein